MATENPDIILKYKLDKDFAANFDELVNIDVENRKSDIGFTEQNKLMILMRPGTVQIGNTIAGGTGTSKQFFYTDFTRVRWHYRGYNNKLWYNNAGTWTDIGTFSGIDMNFNVVKLPLKTDGTTPTTYTTPSISAGAEQVKISATDPQFGVAGGNVGKVLMIISDTVYKGVFGTIIANDGVDYTLLGSGIIQALSAGATYKIYDVLGEYLQVMDGQSNDRYFQGVTEVTTFAGFTKDSLRLIQAITSSQYPHKQVAFNFSMWSFNKTTLFYSAGQINNPFFHNLNGTYTLPFSGDIVDIFTFKNRLIVGGTNFVVVINPDMTYDIKSSSFGIKLGSLVDLGDDMYFLASSGQIKSLSEVVSGTTTTIVLNDIGKVVNNYTKNFLSSICAGFDGRKMYMYGQVDASTIGTIVVFDVLYKFWSTYTGLRPSSIIQEDGITYLTSNNTDKVSKFDSTVFTDLGTAIEQRIAIKEIDLGDVFTTKELHSTYFWLENFTQNAIYNVYIALPNLNTLIYTKEITVSERVQPAIPSPSLGLGQLGANILGGAGFTSSISYPYMIKFPFPIDKGNIWKAEIVGKNGSPFYLNEFEIIMKFTGVPRKFFSPFQTF